MQCHQEEGAALVVTSPAELQKMANNNPLRQYLHRNGPRMFEFLQEKHKFAQRSSLYIVTGTVLSASWAIATYGHPMKVPHNTLALKHYVGDENRQPFWAWTQRASAHVRVGGTRASNKDQCLFLHGFLITPSLWPPSDPSTPPSPSTTSESSVMYAKRRRRSLLDEGPWLGHRRLARASERPSPRVLHPRVKPMEIQVAAASGGAAQPSVPPQRQTAFAVRVKFITRKPYV
ncbi:hypothetical protein BKA70DRAFT_1419197 [Coprinopsis sp. MPI-PUGE-AT-0042]|nr:hypothetical protein BKA70DRAFT_1419197 [Coprinopsis sp. MPI-PUGE-AT-0042]